MPYLEKAQLMGKRSSDMMANHFEISGLQFKFDHPPQMDDHFHELIPSLDV